MLMRFIKLIVYVKNGIQFCLIYLLFFYNLFAHLSTKQ